MAKKVIKKTNRVYLNSDVAYNDPYKYMPKAQEGKPQVNAAGLPQKMREEELKMMRTIKPIDWSKEPKMMKTVKPINWDEKKK